MSVKSAHLFECDYPSCSRSSTVEATGPVDVPPVPPTWVLIASMEGCAVDGGHILTDGAIFCGPDHAVKWFEDEVNPPQEAEAMPA